MSTRPESSLRFLTWNLNGASGERANRLVDLLAEEAGDGPALAAGRYVLGWGGAAGRRPAAVDELPSEVEVMASDQPEIRWIDLKPAPKDEQFAELVELDRQRRAELAALFGVPPELMRGARRK